MKKLISLNEVSYTYNENVEPRKFVLNNVSFDINENFFTLIFGENNSGKTTLLKLISGELNLIYGDIKIDGESIKGASRTKINKLLQKFSIVTNNPIDQIIYDSKLKNYLEFYLQNHHYKKEVIPQVIDEVCKVTNLKSSLNKTIQYFKSSDLRKLYLVQALLSSKKYIIIDDLQTLIPTKMMEDFLLYLKENCKDKTIILISDTDEIISDYVDKVLELNDGLLVEEIIYSEVPRLERDF